MKLNLSYCWTGKTIRFVAVFLALYTFADGQRARNPNPILQVVEDASLVLPKRLMERPTTTNIHGTACKATEWTDVSLSRNGSTYRLEYEREIDVEDFRDPCLEGDVPEIKMRFDLTFEESPNPKRISFKGHVVPQCKDCRPRAAQLISGTLSQLGRDRFELSFTGDLSAALELETLK